jgi:hypothetical protein
VPKLISYSDFYGGLACCHVCRIKKLGIRSETVVGSKDPKGIPFKSMLQNFIFFNFNYLLQKANASVHIKQSIGAGMARNNSK